MSTKLYYVKHNALLFFNVDINDITILATDPMDLLVTKTSFPHQQKKVVMDTTDIWRQSDETNEPRTVPSHFISCERKNVISRSQGVIPGTQASNLLVSRY